MNSLSPQQARQQLDEAAERAQLGHSDARVGALLTGGLSIVIAATLTAATRWRHSPVGLSLSLGFFLAAMGAMLGVYSMKVKVTDRRWQSRYLLGFGLTMVLYTGGIFWEAFAFPGWAIFAPYCVLVAVPGIVAAFRMLRR